MQDSDFALTQSSHSDAARGCVARISEGDTHHIVALWQQRRQSVETVHLVDKGLGAGRHAVGIAPNTDYVHPEPVLGPPPHRLAY